MTIDDDGDAGSAFDRAAARATRREAAGTGGRLRWINEHRYRAAVGRFVLVAGLLAAHLVAARAVTGWLIAHLVLLAILASQVARRRLARNDSTPLPQ